METPLKNPGSATVIILFSFLYHVLQLHQMSGPVASIIVILVCDYLLICLNDVFLQDSSSSKDSPYPGSLGNCKMTSCPGTEVEKDSSSISKSAESLHKQKNSLSETNIADFPLDRISYVCSHHGPKIVSFTENKCCSDNADCTDPLLEDNTNNLDLPKTSQVTLQRELSSISSESSASFGQFNDSSNIMCRICHCGEEEEKLMITCRCMGTVKYAHQNCVLNWISKSGNQYCELCKYKFKTRRKKVKSLWKVSRFLCSFDNKLPKEIAKVILHWGPAIIFVFDHCYQYNCYC